MSHFLTIALGLAAILAGCGRSNPYPISRSDPPFASDDADPNLVRDRYQQCLARYIRPDGRVDLAAWKDDPAAQRHLDGYLAWIDRTDPASAFSQPADRAAFYLNAYAAGALRAVLNAYPIKTLRDGPADFFDEILLPVGGEWLTFSQCAERARRFEDWRIDFALGLPVVGGPYLRTDLYAADSLDRQLAEDLRRYLGGCAGLRFDYESQTVLLGRCLWQKRDWFIEVYRRAYGLRPTLITALIPWAAERTQRQLADHIGFRTGMLAWEDRIYDVPAKSLLPKPPEEEILPCGIH
ncbi:MAG: DUF547 domain-containing protein [Sedimentisphaerales bacterium]|nr:DUF547 domain-containing protein [Sedimentisphaerales bacterium]